MISLASWNVVTVDLLVGKRRPFHAGVNLVGGLGHVSSKLSFRFAPGCNRGFCFVGRSLVVAD